MATRVLQNSQIWLELTQTWLYTQLQHLPDDIQRVVASYSEENITLFPQDNRYTFAHTWQGKLIAPLVSRGRFTRGRFALYNRWILGIMRQVNPQILHSHFAPLGWYVLKAAQAYGVKHVVTFYGNDVHQVPTQYPHWLKKYQDLFQSIDCVLCEGPYMASSVQKLGCAPDKIRVHHLGVQLDKLQLEVRQFMPKEPLKILLVASFREKKGIPDALEAIGKFAKHYPVQVTLIGDANKDPIHQQEKAKIFTTIRKYALSDRLQWLGYQPYTRVIQEMYQHHVFLSPSIHAKNGDTEGGAPVTLIEALASGMMIVSTTHCDIPNVITHGETGLLAPEHDPDTLVAHLGWLVEHPEKWSEMAHAGRKRIEEHFDARKQGIALGAIYRDLATQ